MDAPLKSYGLEYKCNGHLYVFDIPANSEDEAKQRAECLSNYVFIGEMKSENKQIVVA